MPRKDDMRNIRVRWVRNKTTGQLEKRYLAQVRVKDRITGNTVYKATQFKAHKSATDWRDNTADRIRQGEYGENIERRKELYSVTLGDALNKVYTDTGFVLGRGWSFRKEYWHNEQIILHAFMEREANGLLKIPLPALKQPDIQGYIDRRKKDVGGETLRREITVVRSILNYGAKPTRNWFPISIPTLFRGLEFPKIIVTEKHILTANEIGRIYQAILNGLRGRTQQYRWICLFTVARWTGLRRGELLKLEWRDVEHFEEYPFDKGTLHVRAETSKTGKPRLLPLTRTACEAFYGYRETIPEQYKGPNCKIFGPIEPERPAIWSRLFEGERRKKRVFGLTPGGLEQAWSKITKLADVKVPLPKKDGEPQQFRPFVFHELRHNFQTNVLRKPIGLLWEQSEYLMGHEQKGEGRKYDWRRQAFPYEMVDEIRVKLIAADELFYNSPELNLMPVELIANLTAFFRAATGKSSLWQYEDDGPFEGWEEKDGRIVLKRKKKEAV
jgi:integrase